MSSRLHFHYERRRGVKVRGRFSGILIAKIVHGRAQARVPIEVDKVGTWPSHRRVLAHVDEGDSVP